MRGVGRPSYGLNMQISLKHFFGILYLALKKLFNNPLLINLNGLNQLVWPT